MKKMIAFESWNDFVKAAKDYCGNDCGCKAVNYRSTDLEVELERNKKSMLKIMMLSCPDLAKATLDDFFEDNKILKIKFVRDITDWGLKTAKDFVEGKEVNYEEV